MALFIPFVLAAQDAVLHISVVSGEGAVYAAGAHAVKPLTIEVTDATGQPVAGARVSFQAPGDGPGGVFGSGLPTDLATTDSSGRATVHSLQLNRVPGAFQIRITAAKEQARAGTVVKQFIGDTNAATQSADRKAPLPASAPPAKQATPEPRRPAASPQAAPLRAEPARVATVALPQPGTEAIPGQAQSRPARVPTIILTQRGSKPIAEVGATSSHKSHKKWVWLGLLAAGGAAGALAGTGMISGAGHGTATPAVAAGISAAVTIGAPTINIGKP
jgi:hypothetical protein